MTPAFRYVLLWLVGAIAIVAAAMTLLSAAYVDGHYVPSNADAFYHARRILDMVMTGMPVLQFDAYMHVPEGSWITWPWGYDAALAQIVSLFGPYRDEAAAMATLAYVPVFAAPLSVALAVVLSRQYGLTFAYSALFVLAFAATPLVFMRFAVGNVDHHFAELIWVQATLCAGAWFLDAPGRRAPAIVLGVVLGSAVAVQNGLFLLAVLVTGGFAVLWVRKLPLPDPGRTQLMGGVLVLTTLLVCFPSQPWRAGRFEFYTLSWFHLYVAVCCAVFSVAFARLRCSGRSIALLVGIATALALPLAGNLNLGMRFMSGSLSSLDGVVEAMSPYSQARVFGMGTASRFATYLIWLSLPALVVNLWWALRDAAPRSTFLAVVSVVGLSMLQSQVRLSVYGIASLLITPIVLVHRMGESHPERRRQLGVATLFLYLACFMPTRNVLTTHWVLAADPTYGALRREIHELAVACGRKPGVVLAPINDGHWIRFHTKCSVIGNVFLMTEQHLAKVRETDALLELSPRELLERKGNVSYVLAHLDIDWIIRSGHPEPSPATMVSELAREPALTRALLGDLNALPCQYTLVAASKTSSGVDYSRLFELKQDAHCGSFSPKGPAGL